MILGDFHEANFLPPRDLFFLDLMKRICIFNFSLVFPSSAR